MKGKKQIGKMVFDPVSASERLSQISREDAISPASSARRNGSPSYVSEQFYLPSNDKALSSATMPKRPPKGTNTKLDQEFSDAQFFIKELYSLHQVCSVGPFDQSDQKKQSNNDDEPKTLQNNSLRQMIFIEAWKQKSFMKKADAKKYLIAHLDTKYPYWRKQSLQIQHREKNIAAAKQQRNISSPGQTKKKGFQLFQNRASQLVQKLNEQDQTPSSALYESSSSIGGQIESPLRGHQKSFAIDQAKIKPFEKCGDILILNKGNFEKVFCMIDDQKLTFYQSRTEYKNKKILYGPFTLQELQCEHIKKAKQKYCFKIIHEEFSLTLGFATLTKAKEWMNQVQQQIDVGQDEPYQSKSGDDKQQLPEKRPSNSQFSASTKATKSPQIISRQNSTTKLSSPKPLASKIQNKDVQSSQDARKKYNKSPLSFQRQAQKLIQNSSTTSPAQNFDMRSSLKSKKVGMYSMPTSIVGSKREKVLQKYLSSEVEPVLNKNLKKAQPKQMIIDMNELRKQSDDDIVQQESPPHHNRDESKSDSVFQSVNHQKRVSQSSQSQYKEEQKVVMLEEEEDYDSNIFNQRSQSQSVNQMANKNSPDLKIEDEDISIQAPLQTQPIETKQSESPTLNSPNYDHKDSQNDFEELAFPQDLENSITISQREIGRKNQNRNNSSQGAPMFNVRLSQTIQPPDLSQAQDIDTPVMEEELKQYQSRSAKGSPSKIRFDQLEEEKGWDTILDQRSNDNIEQLEILRGKLNDYSPISNQKTTERNGKRILSPPTEIQGGSIRLRECEQVQQQLQMESFGGDHPFVNSVLEDSCIIENVQFNCNLDHFDSLHRPLDQIDQCTIDFGRDYDSQEKQAYEAEKQNQEEEEYDMRKVPECLKETVQAIINTQGTIIFDLDETRESLVYNKQNLRIYARFQSPSQYEEQIGKQDNETWFLSSLQDVYTQGQTNIDNFSIIKAQVILETSAEQCFATMKNPEMHVKKYNPQVESLETVQEIDDWTVYQMAYSRKYIKMNLGFHSQGIYYVVERSIDTQSSSKAYTKATGTVHLAGYKITPVSPSTCEMIMIYCVDMGGFWKTRYQSAQMALKEIKISMQGLQNYLKMNNLENSTFKQSRNSNNSSVNIFQFGMGQPSTGTERTTPRMSSLKQGYKDINDEEFKQKADEALKALGDELLKENPSSQNAQEESEKEQKILDEYDNRDLAFLNLPEDNSKYIPEILILQAQKGFERNEKKCLNFVDQETIAAQKKVLGHFLSQMGSNLIQGKSIINVSLPVYIFEPRSFLQKQAQDFTQFPYFMKKAAEETDPVQKMKWVAAAKISSQYISVQMKKPFNPILGETYQGKIAEYDIVMEQISHHPPISAWQMFSDVDDSFTMDGYAEYRANMYPTCVTGQQVGKVNIILKDGTQYVITEQPSSLIYGIISGDRSIEASDNLIIIDRTNHLKCQVVFNPEKPSGMMSIFKSNPTPADFFDGIISSDFDIDWVAQRKQKVDRKADRLYGYWTSQLFFKTQEIWNLNKMKPNELRDIPNALPSDSKFREDSMYLKINRIQDAQRWKETLEVNQRNDRKLRAAVVKQ